MRQNIRASRRSLRLSRAGFFLITRNKPSSCVSPIESMSESETDKPEQIPLASPSAEHARTALIARLDQLRRKPVRPPKSLQPTPEAAKSKIRRLRRKRQLLIQGTRKSVP